MHTTTATEQDVRQTPIIQEALAQRAVPPAEHLVDTAYVNAEHLVTRQTQRQIALIGPVYEDRQWQAVAQKGVDVAHFPLDGQAHQAICPQGQQSLRWSETHTARRKTMIHSDFAADDCLPCPVRQTGTRARGKSRSLTLPGYEE